MTRKFLMVGLITAFGVAGLSESSEAGHHHRRARNTAGQNCGASPCSTVNAGSSTCASGGNAYASGQSYGATSYGSQYGSNSNGNTGVYGNYGMPAGQSYIGTNAGGSIMGGSIMGGRLLGR